MEPSEWNPYKPPSAASGDSPGEPAPGAPDASRWTRLAAALVDGFINLALVLPLQYAAGVFDERADPVIPPALGTVFWTLLSIVGWLAVNGSLLRHNAQTVGKKLFRIQVVEVGNERPAPFQKLVFIRYLPVTVLSMTPVVGGFLALADVVTIFRADRRCLHDHLAGTRVIQL